MLPETVEMWGRTEAEVHSSVVKVLVFEGIVVVSDFLTLLCTHFVLLNIDLFVVVILCIVYFYSYICSVFY